MDNGQKIGVVASVITVAGGVLWLLNKSSSTDTPVALPPAPNAAAPQQVQPAQIGSGPGMQPVQFPYANPVPNYPSWNANVGIPGNLPEAIVGTTAATAPGYLLYNLPPNGTNTLTSTPQATTSLMANMLTNLGDLPSDFVRAMRGVWARYPAPADTSGPVAKAGDSGGCGCGCGGSGSGCGGSKTQTFSSAVQQAANMPVRTQEAITSNNQSAFQNLGAIDTRTMGAAEYDYT